MNLMDISDSGRIKISVNREQFVLLLWIVTRCPPLKVLKYYSLFKKYIQITALLKEDSPVKFV